MQNKSSYNTFQPTTILHLSTDDALNGDSCTYIIAQDEGAGMYVAVEQPLGSGIVITADEWPVLRTEINRMFDQIEQLEKKQQVAVAQERTGLTDAWNLCMRNAGGTD